MFTTKSVYKLISNSRISLFTCLSLNLSQNTLPKSHTNFSQNMNSINESKQRAAEMAVDIHVKNGHKVGIGSGSTIVFAVERIRENKLDVICVPTSFQSKQLIRENGLKLSDLEETPELDVAIDGADEVDNDLTLIKGGGAALTQEKIVAVAAKEFVVIVDYTKKATHLGQQWVKGLPIEVIPIAYKTVANKIERQLGGKAVLRKAVAKAGPVVTDNSNFIIDWHFDKDVKRGTKEWTQINNKIKMMAGVVETGLFINMCSKVYFGEKDLSVSEFP